MNLQTIEERDKNHKELIVDPNKYLKHTFYFWAFLIPIIFGSRTLAIEHIYADPYWILFIESAFMIVISLALTIMLYGYIGKSRISLFNFLFRYITIFDSYKIIFLAFLAGFGHIMANFSFILAEKFNLWSGGSQGPLLCSLVVNTFISLGVGLKFFNEKHNYRQYLGGIIMITATIVIISCYTFEFELVISITRNLYFILSLVLAIVASALWAVPIICGKCSMYYSDVNPIEFGILSMFFSGFIGCFSILILIFTQTKFSTLPNQSVIYTVVRIGFASLFTVFGYCTIFKATSIGSIGVVQLFVNIKIVALVIEEFLFKGEISNLFITSIAFLALIVGT
mmetsp:Transcript_19822/g.17518  ORF Transcript_19822/g.17518 Transcript_19822/m.17518 type:complete len:340 (-) Transcript_19822:159-1178(-)